MVRAADVTTLSEEYQTIVTMQDINSYPIKFMLRHAHLSMCDVNHFRITTRSAFWTCFLHAFNMRATRTYTGSEVLGTNAGST